MGKRDHRLAAVPDNGRKKNRRRIPLGRANAEPVGADDPGGFGALAPMKLLLIEADPFLSWEFKQLLDTAGFDVEIRSSARETANEAALADFPVVMIGTCARPGDRASLLRRLHERADAAPSLVLAAANRRNGDPYRSAPPREHLVEEFQIEATVTRLLALLTRTRIARGLALRFGNVMVDGDGQVVVGRKVAHFQPTEVVLLSLLIRGGGKIVSKKSIVAQFYGKAGRSSANAVEVYVHRLRRSLAAAAANVRIQTIRNAGYFIAQNDSAD
jgi:DNA-binding response OmpR family regulator